MLVMLATKWSILPPSHWSCIVSPAICFVIFVGPACSTPCDVVRHFPGPALSRSCIFSRPPPLSVFERRLANELDFGFPNRQQLNGTRCYHLLMAVGHAGWTARHARDASTPRHRYQCNCAIRVRCNCRRPLSISPLRIKQEHHSELYHNCNTLALEQNINCLIKITVSLLHTISQ